MWAVAKSVIGALFASFRPRATLVVENLALRQQLAILLRATPRPRLRPIDRAFWVLLSRAWSRWPDLLAIVKPATVIAWHRRGFARFWAWKSRRIGRPPLADELVALIERMAAQNPAWSRRRIAMELAKLGHAVDKDTVAKYMPKPSSPPRRPRSQTWKTFLRNPTPGPRPELRKWARICVLRQHNDGSGHLSIADRGRPNAICPQASRAC